MTIRSNTKSTSDLCCPNRKLIGNFRNGGSDLRPKGDPLRVGVHDRGSGIPENFRGRIFGRFTQANSATTRQKGGTGLGLAICKRLIELMQGRIGFEDRAGGGTTFWFELPPHTA